MSHSGTFLVTAVDGAAILRSVADGRVFALEANPGFDAGEVVDATLEPTSEMQLAWTLVEVLDRRTIPVEAGDDAPVERARAAVADGEPGDLVRLDGANADEVRALHVLRVPAGDTDAAVADVVEDEATVERAARLGASRVEVRGVDGVVSVRYLD